MEVFLSRIFLTVLIVIVLIIVWTKPVNLKSYISKAIESALPIDNSAKTKLSFDVSAAFGLGPVEVKNFPAEQNPWRKASLMYKLFVQTNTSKWAEDTVMGIIYYSGDRLHDAESDIPTWALNAVTYKSNQPKHRRLHRTFSLGKINPASRTAIKNYEYAAISIDHSPWNAAVYVVEKDAEPQWFQFTLKKDSPKLEPKGGSGVPIRNFKLTPTKKPVVSIGNELLVELDSAQIIQ